MERESALAVFLAL